MNEVVFYMRIKLYIPWAVSLKEKRSVVKSCVSGIKNKFNVSVRESDLQDVIKNTVISVSGLCDGRDRALKSMEEIEIFIEKTTDVRMTDISRDIF